MKITISPDWTLEERIKIATCLLSKIQLDIPAGTYSYPGNPNITSIQAVLNYPKEYLEHNRYSLEQMLARL